MINDYQLWWQSVVVVNDLGVVVVVISGSEYRNKIWGYFENCFFFNEFPSCGNIEIRIFYGKNYIPTK